MLSYSQGNVKRELFPISIYVPKNGNFSSLPFFDRFHCKEKIIPTDSTRRRKVGLCNWFTILPLESLIDFGKLYVLQK